MLKYPKIQSLFKRDKKTHKFLEDKFSLPEFDYLQNNIWEATEKINGTNTRVMWDGHNITFGGKTDKAEMPVFLYLKLAEKFHNKEMKLKFREIFGEEGNVCLFGEGYGARIQKGGGNYISNGVDFILFDIFIGKWWLQREQMIEIAEKLEVKVVPLIMEDTIPKAIEFIKENESNSTFGEFKMEGLVLKTKVGLVGRNGKRIITKIKLRDFSGHGHIWKE